MAHISRKKEHEAKILFTNQRSPAEQGSGTFGAFLIPPALLVVADYAKGLENNSIYLLL